MEKINITVIGAGVIGLSVAAELSGIFPDVFVIEKNTTFGQETSSRNSEVIHAGIYYPKDSLKSATCIEGRQLLYAFCAQNNIPHKRIGKLIVALDTGEVKDLEALFKQGRENGVQDLQLLSGQEVKIMEPHIRAEAAVYSPSTGILDTHSFMKNLALQIESRHGQLAYNTQLMALEKIGDGFLVRVTDGREGTFTFFSRIVINCAGLDAEKVSVLAGLAKEEYKLKYCKGDYFRVHNRKAGYISRLIYPVPKKRQGGLGIHATLDLAGGLRLGPDDEYVDRIDYRIDSLKQKRFYESTRQFLPFINLEDILADMAGIRPKLQGPGEDFRDFIIRDEKENGFPGLINLIGIESPGLTASLSIAKMVKAMLKGQI